MNKHTPGPWELKANETEAGWNLTANDDLLIAQLYIHGATTGGPSSVKESQANARLIAAAPDLLAYAECEEARSRGEDIAETVLKRHGFNPAECTAIEFMDRMRRAAIAKATGA
jgi:hypothetical protein